MSTKYKIDHDYHIHSYLSSCSRDDEQTTARMLKYAKENSFSSICITDHYWDSAVEGVSNWYAPQNFEHISKSLPLPYDKDVKFLFGCECEMDKNMRLGMPESRFEDFDFVIIPTTHMHMKNFTVSEADMGNAPRCAELWVERLDALLSMALPFGKIGIAHLSCNLLNPKSREEALKTLDLIPNYEMERLFSKAASLGVGIELNKYDMMFEDSEADTILRPFKIAKHMGCKFYLGTDAHHPDFFDGAVEVFERAVTMLGLTENDKFYIETL